MKDRLHVSPGHTRKTNTMLGGPLTRYHTPTMHGKGIMQELVKLAGPSLVRSIGHGLQVYENGASASDALKSSGEVLKRGLKRKLPAAVGLVLKTKAKQSYKKKRQRVRGLIMRRAQRSQSRVRHQRSVGRYHSPYQYGGNIIRSPRSRFDVSTYPPYKKKIP